MPWLGPLLTVAGLAITLAGTAGKQTTVAGIGKMVASSGMLVAAWQWGALSSVYGTTVFVGLCLGWLGDLALISTQKRWFLTGLAVFLLGHGAYAMAFIRQPLQTTWLLAGIGVAVLLAAAVTKWLWTRAGSMRIPVLAYIVVICTMLSLAVGAAGVHWSIPAGAVLFAASDLFVARHRFITAEPVNRYVGLPLYFAGQLLIAYSVAA